MGGGELTYSWIPTVLLNSAPSAINPKGGTVGRLSAWRSHLSCDGKVICMLKSLGCTSCRMWSRSRAAGTRYCCRWSQAESCGSQGLWEQAFHFSGFLELGRKTANLLLLGRRCLGQEHILPTAWAAVTSVGHAALSICFAMGT